MGTRMKEHTHRFTFYPNGANTIDGGKYVCDCGATPLDVPYDPEHDHHALIYMWGALSAVAGRDLAVRDAMMAAVAIAEADRYLTAAEASEYRARMTRWVSSPDR